MPKIPQFKLERGGLLRLDGPSVRTLHVNLDEAIKEDSSRGYFFGISIFATVTVSFFMVPVNMTVWPA